MNARTLPAACLLMTLCLPASAGLIFRETTGSTGVSPDTDARRVTETMVEGSRARILTVEAPDNPMMRAGTYMLAPGGDVMYIVDPARRTYARFDLGEMRGVAQKTGSQNEQLSTERNYSGVELTQQLDEAGPQLLGLPTRHCKYTLAYVETTKVPGSPQPMEKHVREVHEFWATLTLPDSAAPAMSAMAKGEAARRAVAEAEAKMRSHGFILKETISGESSLKMPGMGGGFAGLALRLGGGGSTDKYTTTREITELRQENIADSMFVLPAGYRETELFAAPGTASMPDLDGVPAGDAGGQAGEPDLDAIPKQ